jgi:dTDP-4-dehydrorhamnose reductase
MKIILTGADGQLGYELKKQVKNYDYELISFSKIDLDITNIGTIRKCVDNHRPDIIINSAAYTNVDKAETDIFRAEAVNCLGPKNLATICKENSIILIHISTDYVFSGHKEDPYIESDETKPINTYGITKLKGEKEIISILDNHIILRTSWIFGIHGNNFVKTILRLIKEKDSLDIVSDQFGCPTSARSIAIAILDICAKCVNDKKFPFGIYHYCSSPITSWYSFSLEIMNLAFKKGLIKKKININPITSKKYNSISKKPLNSSINSKKISTNLGIVTTSWLDELKYTLKALK